MAEPRRIRVPIQAPVVAILLLLAGLAVYRWHSGQRGDPDHLVVSGTVESKQVSVGSKVGGRVETLLVAEGDTVHPGQLLARFDSAELQQQLQQLTADEAAAQAQVKKLQNGARPQELSQAQAAVEAAQAHLAELQHGTRHEDIATAKHNWEAAQALAKEAAAEYDRFKALYDQGYVSHQELDQELAKKNSTRQDADALRAQYEKAGNGTRSEEVAAAAAQVKQAQAAHDLLAAGARSEDIAAAKAQADAVRAQRGQVQTRLAESKVYAPQAGVILTVSHQAGDLVAPNQPLFELMLSGTNYVQVFVPENRLSWAQPGAKVSLRVDGYPNEHFTGTVNYLSTVGEYTPRNLQTTEKRVEQTFRCKVGVDDPSSKLRSGMVCDVTFTLPAGARGAKGG